MNKNKDSSFLQGLEGSLNSSVDIENQKKNPFSDHSKVISEIEKSFNSIFGEDGEEVKEEIKEQPAGEETIAIAEVPEKRGTDIIETMMQDVEGIILKAEQSDRQSINLAPSELNAVPYSPLSDIKNIIKSLEWELSNAVFDQLDSEIIKLYELNEGNSTILWFLQILQFLGRYIRARGPAFNQTALTLLISIYDNLEDIILSEDMTAANKHNILLEDINKYQEWTYQVDGTIEFADVRSEKDRLDMILSSIPREEVIPSIATNRADENIRQDFLQYEETLKAETPDYREEVIPSIATNTTDETETIRQDVLQYEQTLKAKTLDYAETITVKGEKATPAMGNNSPKQSFEVNINDQKGRFQKQELPSHKITWIALIIVLFTLSITAAGFLWFYPDRRNQVMHWMVTHIPYADRILTVEKASNNNYSGKIKLIDVRHRFISNNVMGRSIRVVEGIVINNTSDNISNVKLSGELYNEKGSLLLRSKPSLAGNILTDDKLEQLDEDKIFSALSIVAASNLSEAMIPPQGEVPFMIVFTREPDKVFKLVIIPALE